MGMTKSEIKKHLEHIFEDSDVLSDSNYLIPYSTDASQIKGQAKFVVFPKELDQIRRLVLFAARNKYTLVPRGAGTGLVGGVVPNNSIVVDLSRMIRISEFNKTEKTIWVEPGVILEKLNSYLKQFNLYYPVIPSSHTVATIGGMVATNAAGLRAVKFGKMSDNTLEVHMVDGTGKYSKIKDSSIFGSEGTLGIITKVKLQLEEISKERSITVFTIDTVDELVKIFPKLREDSHITALEFMDKISSSKAGLENKYHLIAEFDNDLGDIKDESEISNVWKIRESLRTIYGGEGYDVIEDPYIPDESIGEFIEWTERNDLPCFGHLGVGIMHIHLKSTQKILIEKMFNLVQKLDGDISGEHGIGLLKKDYVDKEFKQKIIELKAKYDPYDIMNTGKIVGPTRNGDW